MNLSINNNPVYINENLNNLNELLKQLKLRKKLFVITDSNLYSLYSEKLRGLLDFDLEFIVIPSGEASKNMDELLKAADKLIKGGIKRNDYILSFGGGMISDLTGFLASILYRGIYHIVVPTSLLAMVDAGIGGKTGVDFAGRKNILGAFKNPQLIYIAKDLLNTLPVSELNSGYGEVFKYSFLEKTHLYDLLAKKADISLIIQECILIKKKYVEEDFYDQGERMKLNLGHTFGHLVEIKYNLPHGIAVISGMKMIFNLEKDLNIIDNTYLDRLNHLLAIYNIKAPDYDYKPFLTDIFNDKKNLKGVLNLIFVKDDKAYIDTNTKEELYAKINS